MPGNKKYNSSFTASGKLKRSLKKKTEKGESETPRMQESAPAPEIKPQAHVADPTTLSHSSASSFKVDKAQKAGKEKDTAETRPFNSTAEKVSTVQNEWEFTGAKPKCRSTSIPRRNNTTEENSLNEVNEEPVYVVVPVRRTKRHRSHPSETEEPMRRYLRGPHNVPLYVIIWLFIFLTWIFKYFVDFCEWLYDALMRSDDVDM